MGKEKIMDRQLPNLPKEVLFCKKCVISNQRPRIVFDEEGVCSACRYAEEKKTTIDWDSRAGELKALCDKHRRSDGRYDVLVPGSGGKDSAAVAHKLKHWYGMNPLTITWAPFIYTDIGWENYQSFIASGFTNILTWPNRKVHRKLARAAFEAVGDVFLPFIFGQMFSPFHLALKFDIPMVFYGENGEAEYGGNPDHKDLPCRVVDESWADLYLKGVTVDDLIDWGKDQGIITEDDYTESDLVFYRPPAMEELKKKNLHMYWFSYFHRWVPQENYYYATEHTGFKANTERSEGTYSKYASIDDRLDGFHYYFMLMKFGIGRATSDAAHEIRDGHLTREEGVALVNRYDTEPPTKHFRECLEYLDITEEKFWEVADRYRSQVPHIWEKRDGEWRLKNKVK